MSEFRTEMNIPVTRDTRTFEQRRKDMLTNLERRTSSRRTEQTNISRSGISDTSGPTMPSDNIYNRSLTGHGDDWDHEVDRWISESRQRWNEEMRRMRKDMFALEPVDDFDMDPWKNIGDRRPFEPIGDHSSMIAKMEREMQSLRDEMSSMSTFGSSTRMPTLGGSSSVKSSTSRITTSSTKTTSGDPLGTKTKSNVQESIQQSRTVNGVTTGTSSHSSMSTTSTGKGVVTAITDDKSCPGALLPPGSKPESGNFFNNSYELDEDGQVHFMARFDAKDFDPEDIDVTTLENKLTVSAKKHIKTGETETQKEFCRTIELPRTIDHERFRCNLTEDGVLILDAPVKAADYESITFDKGQYLGIRPKSEMQLKTSTASSRTASLVPIGASEPTILKDGANGRKLRLEVPVDSGYRAEDLCVRMEANSLIVSGKQMSDGSTNRQFTRTYDIPEAVDPFTVTAQLIGNTLVIEAPLLCTV